MAPSPGSAGDGFDEDGAWVAAHGIEQPVARGQRVACEAADAVFVVLEGSFVVASEGLGIAFLWRAGPGEIVGELLPAAAVPPPGTVRAESDGAVLEIPRAALDARLRGDAAFAARLAPLAAGLSRARLRDLRERNVLRQRVGDPARAREVEGLPVHELIERLLRGDIL